MASERHIHMVAAQGPMVDQRRTWSALRSQTRRGVRSGAVLGAIAPIAALTVAGPSEALLASMVVPLAGLIGGWALTPRS